MAVITGFRLNKSHITVGGGGLSKVSQSFNAAFKAQGWNTKKSATKIAVDAVESESPTHLVDEYEPRESIYTKGYASSNGHKPAK